MPRPHEIAADARALYGPLALRPSAQEAGDGALWVDPSAQVPLSHVQSGNWVPLAPAGVPVLYGPYTVEYTDIPHDGDKMTLWLPRVGDVLLRLFPDGDSLTQWDHGALFVGQEPFDGTSGYANVLTYSPAGSLGGGLPLDLAAAVDGGNNFDGAGTNRNVTAKVFHASAAVTVQLAGTGGTDPTAGHVELFALVARPVAP